MPFVYVLTDVGVPKQERHIQLSLLTSQSAGHCSPERAPSKYHHLWQP